MFSYSKESQMKKDLGHLARKCARQRLAQYEQDLNITKDDATN